MEVVLLGVEVGHSGCTLPHPLLDKAVIVMVTIQMVMAKRILWSLLGVTV